RTTPRRRFRGGRHQWLVVPHPRPGAGGGWRQAHWPGRYLVFRRSRRRLPAHWRAVAGTPPCGAVGICSGDARCPGLGLVRGGVRLVATGAARQPHRTTRIVVADALGGEAPGLATLRRACLGR